MLHGKYIAFLDSDDYIRVKAYQLMYEKAEKEDSDIVECNFYWTYLKRKKKDIGKKYEGKSEMIENGRVVAWNKLYKRELLEQIQIEFPKGLQYEDVEFFYKLVPYVEKISFVKEPLIYYVQRKDSLSNFQNEKVKDIFKVLDNVMSFYKNKNLYEKYKEELEFTYTRLLLCSSFKRITKIEKESTRIELLNETWVKLNTMFPNWKENQILNTNLNSKKRYIKSVNRFTYRIYAKIF